MRSSLSVEDPYAASSLTRDARLIFAEALRRCTVQEAFASKISRSSHSAVLSLRGADDLDLTGVTRIVVLAVGKAASPMLEAFLQDCVPVGCAVSGVLIAPTAPSRLPSEIAYFQGGHPFPNRESFLGAQAALEMLRNAAPDAGAGTFCVFLISGGGSAIMDLPLDPAISLADTIAFHQALVGSGASIAEINCVRKHFSAVKGGRVALAAGELPAITLLVSDVPDGKLDAISSGPTLPDSTTLNDCLEVLARYKLTARFPPAVCEFFRSSLCTETPKPGELQQRAYVLLSSADLVAEARSFAESLGYFVVEDHRCDDWDYRKAADYLLEQTRDLGRVHRRVCLLSAGEVTVQMSPLHGAGGRNQHFALYCATCLRAGERLAVLSAGSDGVDGNSNAAGAAVDSSTLASCREEANRALEQFASFDLLARLGVTIVTGPTGNNLRDLRILLAGQAPGP